MKVLTVLCQRVGATGSGIVVKETVDRLPSLGFDVVVACGGYPGDDPGALFSVPPSALELIEFGTDSPTGLPFPIVGMSNDMPYPSRAFKDLETHEIELYLRVWKANLEEIVARHRPDLIHVHHLWLLAGLVATTFPSTPLVVSVHGTDIRRAADCPHLKHLVAPALPHVAAVVLLTEQSILGALEQWPALAPGRCIALGNGYNHQLFTVAESVDDTVLNRYGIPTPLLRRAILCVAKYDLSKGIDWLIRAFGRVHAGDPETVLIVAGGGPPDERARYEALITRLGLEDSVVLTGPVKYEDVGKLMHAADVFVLPAFHEPFGLVILEALACGCRVVTTDQGGPPCFVPKTLQSAGQAKLVSGLTSTNPDLEEAESFIDSIASAVLKMLATPLEISERRLIAGSVDSMTWDGYVRQLASVFGRAVAGAPPHGS